LIEIEIKPAGGGLIGQLKLGKTPMPRLVRELPTPLLGPLLILGPTCRLFCPFPLASQFYQPRADAREVVSRVRPLLFHPILPVLIGAPLWGRARIFNMG
jgi:hypothetical protein